ncbi:MAG TPA: hypothetical protein VEW74_02690 [Candidatus Nitrosotalea sp.]|nr:hypothetical protein [Candidatus Nitrosotalea sp.]
MELRHTMAQKRKLGGVAGKRPTRVVAAGPAAPAFPDFVYNGGPVIAKPQIYPVFWGSHWSDAPHQQQAARLAQFLRDLIASDWMNILTQYGVGGPGSGEVLTAQYSSSVPATLTDDLVHTNLQKAIDAKTIPEPPANNTTQVIAVFLDESVAVSDSNLGVVMCEPNNDNAFGYHNYFTTKAGNNCYYAIMPALDDACIKNTCGSSANCSLSLSETQEERRTQVTSHELAEMFTDPTFPTGWYGQSSDEIGDICNGETATIAAGANTWNVQRIYSKADDIKTNGQTYCLASAASPIPRVS